MPDRELNWITASLVAVIFLLLPLFTSLVGVRAETAPDPQKRFESILQRSEEWPRLANTYTDWRDAIGIQSLNYVDENCIKIVSGFGDTRSWGRNASWTRAVAHRGVDIPGDGILVRAAADGVVIMTGALEPGPNAPYQRIAILHGPLGEGRFKGLYVIANYGHLKAGSLRVEEKQRVRRGAPLGLTGQTGYSGGVSHLGFETYLVPNERYKIVKSRFGRTYRPTSARIAIDPNLLWYGNGDATINAALTQGGHVSVPSFEQRRNYGLSQLFTYPLACSPETKPPPIKATTETDSK